MISSSSSNRILANTTSLEPERARPDTSLASSSACRSAATGPDACGCRLRSSKRYGAKCRPRFPCSCESHPSARERAQALQDKILAAMRADLAAGVRRGVAIKRAIKSGGRSTAVAEFFGLPRWQVYRIVGPGKPSQWTDQQVELLLSLWADHTAQEI